VTEDRGPLAGGMPLVSITEESPLVDPTCSAAEPLSEEACGTNWTRKKEYGRPSMQNQTSGDDASAAALSKSRPPQ
jgi:hypothetical protein